MEFSVALESLKHGSCPICGNNLNYDVQLDSVYCACHCGDFEISAFRDKLNGSLMLYYLNSNEGGVERENLKRLQKVLYSRKSIKKKLFSLNLKEKMM
jgi:hypothetical protein